MSSAGHTRRDFLYIATSAVGAVGAAAVAWPLISQLNPDASTIAAGAPIEVDLAPIAEGQVIKVFWRAKPIFVFSSTLESVGPNSRLVRGDIGDELAAIRTEFDGDLNVGGATLAASFLRRGLVDEFRLVVHPVILGAGTPYLPPLDERLRLRLTDTHRFASGVTYLAYAVERP